MSTVREHLGLLWLMRRSLMTQNPQYDRKWEMMAALFAAAHLDELIALAGGADVEQWMRDNCVEIPPNFPHSSSQSPAPVTAEPAHPLAAQLRDIAKNYGTGEYLQVRPQMLNAAAEVIEKLPAPADRDAIRDQALEEAALLCEEVSSDKYDQYKGRGKYPPNNPQRADTYTNGESDGANICADKIRALKSMERAAGAAETRDAEGGV